MSKKKSPAEPITLEESNQIWDEWEQLVKGMSFEEYCIWARLGLYPFIWEVEETKKIKRGPSARQIGNAVRAAARAAAAVTPAPKTILRPHRPRPENN
jgi:hypothetical protein